MTGARRPYPADFRAEAVRRVRTSGRSVPQVARELGVSAQSLRNWMRESDPPLTNLERTRLRQLELENRLLRAEREVWRRASAYLAPDVTGRVRAR
jgi:transposase